MTGIAAAVLLVGLVAGILPRTAYSAAYSEKETQQTDSQLPEAEVTVPETRAIEETEPEQVEMVIPKPKTERTVSQAEQTPANHANDQLTMNAVYIPTEEYSQDVRIAVMETEDFVYLDHSCKNEPRDEGWICPLVLDTYVSSPYGMRWHPVYGTYRMHKGVDLDSDWYDDIIAPRSGTVIATGYSDSAGYYVKIDHGNGFVSEYFHLADYFVYVGQDVAQGEVIALVGSTGTSTGAHLHYGMLFEGDYVDPEDYIVFE